MDADGDLNVKWNTEQTTKELICIASPILEYSPIFFQVPNDFIWLNYEAFKKGLCIKMALTWLQQEGIIIHNWEGKPCNIRGIT